MNIQEAFQTLEIEITASKTEIKEKHRAMIKNFHSDKENGSHEKSVLINEARDIALNYVNDKMNVSLIKQVVDIVTVENNKSIQYTEYKTQSDALYTKISRKFGSRYKSYKSSSRTFGLISAIIALLSSKFVSIFPEASKDLNMTIAFTIFAVTSGMLYLVFNSIAERIQDSIDDLKDTLSDKGSYYDILNSILKIKENNKQVLSRHDLEELCAEWFRSDLYEYRERNSLDKALREVFLIGSNSFENTVRRIGIHDFVKFLISKGLEKNILREKEFNDSGLVEIKYEIH
jgi:hypothetical protein